MHQQLQYFSFTHCRHQEMKVQMCEGIIRNYNLQFTTVAIFVTNIYSASQ